MLHTQSRSGSFKTSWRGHAPIGMALIGRPPRRIAPRTIRRGMGVGDTQAQQVLGGAGTVAGAVVSVGSTSALSGTALASLATGPAAPFILAGIAIAALLAHYIGGGCGQACIQASMAEQIYEAAADNVSNIFLAGMIPLAAAVAWMQQILYAGQQHMEALGSTKQIQAGTANMVKTINAEIAEVQNAPTPAPTALDLNAARSHYVSTGKWYPQSESAAATLTDGLVQAAIANQAASAPASAAAAVSGSAPAPAAAGSGLSIDGFSLSFSEIAVGLALLFGGYWVFSEL